MEITKVLKPFIRWGPNTFANIVYVWIGLIVVIDRYWVFITDTDYLHVYVPITDIQNRYLFTVLK